MSSRFLHVSEWINRTAAEVYDYACDPANLVHWARGLGGSVENVDGRWFMDTAAGPIQVTFAEPNSFGVLDHEVTSASGEVIHAPLRVIPDGEGCEVVFSVRRLQGMTDDELARDAALVASDLAALKAVLERRSAQAPAG
jgi:hypothetical protein